MIAKRRVHSDAPLAVRDPRVGREKEKATP